MPFTFGCIAHIVPRISRSIRMSDCGVIANYIPAIGIFDFNIDIIGADLPCWIAPPCFVREHNNVLFSLCSILGDLFIPEEYLADRWVAWHLAFSHSVSPPKYNIDRIISALCRSILDNNSSTYSSFLSSSSFGSRWAKQGVNNFLDDDVMVRKVSYMLANYLAFRRVCDWQWLISLSVVAQDYFWFLATEDKVLVSNCLFAYKYHRLAHEAINVTINWTSCHDMIWTRLTHSYFRREGFRFGAREDWRFADMRKKSPENFWWQSFVSMG